MDNALNFVPPRSTLKEELQMDDDSSSEIPNSNHSIQKSFQAASPAYVTSSISRIFKTVHEPCISNQYDLNKLTDNYSVNSTVYPKETMYRQKPLLIETSVGKNSVAVENQLINSYFPPVREEIKLTGVNRLSLSEETSFFRKIPDPLNISRFSNKRKIPNSTSDTELEQNIPGAIKKIANTNKFMRLASSAPLSHLPRLETSASLLSTEDSKIPAFRHDNEKRMQERNAKRFAFITNRAISNPNTASKHTFPFFNLPSLKSTSTKEFESFYRDLKSPVRLEKFPTNSLHEMLSILESWARSGLDNAFNRPAKSSSIDTKANLEENLKCVLDLLNQMVTRIYTLMRAADELPNTDAILLRKFEQICSDIINTGVNMWNTIEEIESQISSDYSKLILNRDEVLETSSGDLEDEDSEDGQSQNFSDNRSLESISDKALETSSEDMEQESKDIEYIRENRESPSGEDSETSSEDIDQEAKPNILNTNAYTLVTERLPLLWIQVENFREKIRVFCSEIDKLL